MSKNNLAIASINKKKPGSNFYQANRKATVDEVAEESTRQAGTAEDALAEYEQGILNAPEHEKWILIWASVVTLAVLALLAIQFKVLKS